MSLFDRRPRLGPSAEDTDRFPALVSDQAVAPAAFTGVSQPGLPERHHTGPLAVLPAPPPPPVRPPDPRTAWQRSTGQPPADVPPGDAWRHFEAHAPLDIPNPILDYLAPAWQHLLTIDCAYTAAPHETPIPCGSVFSDPDADSFLALRCSAYAAGWRLDAFGRMACPACVQDSAEFRALWPVTFWAPDAAWVGQDDGAAGMWRTSPPQVEDYPVRPEFPLTVVAETAVRERVRAGAARYRHAGAV